MGVNISRDMFPYTWGMSRLANALPPSAYRGGTRQVLRRFSSHRHRARFRRYRGYPQAELIRHDQWDRLIPLDSGRSPYLDGRSFRESRAVEEADAQSVIVDVLKREGADFYGMTWLPLRDILRAMSLPCCMFASDNWSVSPEGPVAKIQVQHGSHGYAPKSVGITVLSSPPSCRSLRQRDE